MLKRLLHILLMTLFLAAPAVAQDTYVIDKVCQGAVRTYRINGDMHSIYTWMLQDPDGNLVALANPAGTDFTDVDGDGNPIQGSEIEIIWSVNPGIYSLSVEQRSQADCTVTELGTVEVVPQAIVYAGEDILACLGATIPLNEATAQHYASLLWTSSGDGSFSDPGIVQPVYTPGPADLASGTFILTITANGEGNAGSCTESVSYLTVTLRKIQATITMLPESGDVCLGNPVYLTATVEGASNILSHTWTGDGAIHLSASDVADPVFSAEAPVGTYTLIYTAIDDLGCEATDEVTITVIPAIEPKFGTIGPFCQNLVAPALPLTSDNGIDGSWTPATISTDVAGTFIFLFTPNDGQCATPVEVAITISPEVVPVFEITQSYCQGSATTELPTTSDNQITGTWVPPVIITATAGTTTYTFTPDEGQCATEFKIEITIDPKAEPEFDPIGPLCQGGVAPALPLISKNGITGSWDPITINTAAAGTFTYTFTPDAGACGLPYPLMIEIRPTIEAEFNLARNLCVGSTPPTLPMTSDNGITGTWDPAVISTAVVGLTTYTFTPDEGQCSAPYPMAITILEGINPVFTQIEPLCQNSTPPTLSLTSDNSVTGTWSPAVINTALAGVTTYTFTPDEALCSEVFRMDITIEPEIKPIFTLAGVLCQNSTPPELKTLSDNDITGTWEPPVIQTADVGTFTYIFKPNEGQCAARYEIDIIVQPLGTPKFAAIGPFCQGGEAIDLSLTSENGITGTWEPSTIDTSIAGTFAFTFTPDEGQCAEPIEIEVIVNPSPELVITHPSTVCAPATVDLTAASVTEGSTTGLVLTYWYDAAATIEVANPAAVATSGTYYIKGTTAAGCSDIQPVIVTVTLEPVLVVHDPPPACHPDKVDLTAGAVTEGSDAGLALTYWRDAGATVELSNPEAVAASGTYYIRAEADGGCSVIRAVTVIIHSPPEVKVTDPDPVCAPATIDITEDYITSGSDAGLIYTYFLDEQCTEPVADPTAISVGGTYYIRGESPVTGCAAVMPVLVPIHPEPLLIITDPAAVTFPSTVDLTAGAVTAGSELGLLLSYWLDEEATISLPDPSIVGVSGTYYIRAENPVTGCSVVKPVQVTVGAMVITVWADNLSKEYGQADPPLTYRVEPESARALLTGEIKRVDGEDIGTYPIQQHTLSVVPGHYELRFLEGVFTIGLRVITVTVDPGQSKTVGDADPATFTYSYSPALQPGDAFSGRLEREPGETVGTYPIRIGSLTAGENYSINFISNDFRIWPRGDQFIYVTALPTGKLEGATDPSLDYIVTPAGLRGVLTGRLLRDPGETPGQYWINQGTLACPADYLIVYTGDWFTITERVITDITVYANPQTKVYGFGDPALTYRVEPLNSGARFTGALGRNGDENVGTYSIHKGNLSAGEYYRINFVPADFDITPRKITVVADAQRKPYAVPANPDPALTYTWSPQPLVFGDYFEGELQRKSGEVPGMYLIMPGSLVIKTPNRFVSNYEIEFVENYLEIYDPNAREIVVTAMPAGKVYGQADPQLGYTFDPPLDEGDSFQGVLDRVRGENVGFYKITQGTLTAGKKYTIRFIPADFEITPVAITVIAEEKWKVYGETDPELTWVSQPELYPGDVFSGSLSRQPGEGIGDYQILRNTLTAGPNYSIEYIGNLLHIRAGVLTIRANDLSRAYGDVNPTLTYSVVGYIGGDDESVLTVKPVLSTVATPASPVGTYEITVCCAASNNYEIRYEPGKLEVTKAPLLIIADDKTKELGDPLPTLTASYVGFVNGDDESILMKAPALSTTATQASPVGVYPILVGGAEDPNYDISYRNGWLTVVDTRVTPVIIWDDPADIIYGTPLSSVQLNARAEYGGEEVTGTFDYDPGAGTVLDAGNGQVLAVHFTPDDRHRFNIADKSVRINVIPLGITGAFEASDKVYDGTTSAVITGSTLIGVLPGDVGRVSLAGGLARFIDPDVGIGKEVVVTGMALSGTRSKNYRLEGVDPSEADILPRALTMVADVADRVYDGTTDATLLSIHLDGIINGDDVRWSGGTAAFRTPDADLGKPVDIQGVTFTGTDLTNYHIEEKWVAEADIYPLEVSSRVWTDKEAYHLLAELVTVTAVIRGGAPLVAGGPQAALSVTFVVDGQVMTDRFGNSEIPLTVAAGGVDLVGELSFPMYQITSVGTVVPGLKHIEARFNRVDRNFDVVPNPAVNEFRYDPVFELLVYPNPSPGVVNFRITMDVGAKVKLDLYTVTGQFITNLFDDYIPSNGQKLITYYATLAQMAQGVYVYRCFDGMRLITGKLVIIPQFD